MATLNILKESDTDFYRDFGKLHPRRLGNNPGWITEDYRLKTRLVNWLFRLSGDQEIRLQEIRNQDIRIIVNW